MAAVDPLGLTVFLIGIGLLVVELANPGYFIGVAGTVGVIVGLIQMAFPNLLFGADNFFLTIGVVVGVAVVSTWVSVEFYRRFAPAVKVPETLSSDALVGLTGRVVTKVEPNSLRGKAKVGGIVWSATSSQPIEEGTDVTVLRVEGVHLVVEPTPSPTVPSGEASAAAGGEVHG